MASLATLPAATAKASPLLANSFIGQRLQSAGETSCSVPRALGAQQQQTICIASQEKDVQTVVTRRQAALLAGSLFAAAAVLPAQNALAAYGDAANVFGGGGNTTGYVQKEGDGFKLSVPAKWNPSKQVELPGQQLRFEDNFDANSNICVTITPTSKGSIEDYGSPEEFLESIKNYLGAQSFEGQTSSEGGFAPGKVLTAAILETDVPVISGKKYYLVSVLTRTADGDEGGKHIVIKGTIAGGKLYVVKAMAGDKRWFKGAKKFVEGSVKSFELA